MPSLIAASLAAPRSAKQIDERDQQQAKQHQDEDGRRQRRHEFHADRRRGGNGRGSSRSRSGPAGAGPSAVIASNGDVARSAPASPANPAHPPRLSASAFARRWPSASTSLPRAGRRSTGSRRSQPHRRPLWTAHLRQRRLEPRAVTGDLGVHPFLDRRLQRRLAVQNLPRLAGEAKFALRKLQRRRLRYPHPLEKLLHPRDPLISVPDTGNVQPFRANQRCTSPLSRIGPAAFGCCRIFSASRLRSAPPETAACRTAGRRGPSAAAPPRRRRW